MDRQMLSTMKESMQIDIVELQSATNFGWLMAIFLYIYGFMSPVSGIIADRLNRKWLIVGSLGVSEALYIPAGLSLIADYHTGKSRSLAVGIHMTGLYTGQAVGGFGATVAAAYSWHTTFHWFGIIGIVYALILMLFLKDKKSDELLDTVSQENPVLSGLFCCILRLQVSRDGLPRTGCLLCLPKIWICLCLRQDLCLR